MAALEREPFIRSIWSALGRRDAAGPGDLEVRSRVSGALSPIMFEHIERMRSQATTVERQSALYRLNSIANRLRDLEIQSESILSQVAAKPDSDDLFEIPEFLRRTVLDPWIDSGNQAALRGFPH
jgi:hypothetical protein